MLTSSQRRGLKMAARLTCVVALGGAIVQVATAQAAESAEPNARESASGAREGAAQGESAPTVAEALRLSPRSGGCWPSWGPIAPPAASFAALDGAARDACLAGGDA